MFWVLKKTLIEAVLFSTHNICFSLEINDKLLSGGLKHLVDSEKPADLNLKILKVALGRNDSSRSTSYCMRLIPTSCKGNP